MKKHRKPFLLFVGFFDLIFSEKRKKEKTSQKEHKISILFNTTDIIKYIYLLKQKV